MSPSQTIFDVLFKRNQRGNDTPVENIMLIWKMLIKPKGLISVPLSILDFNRSLVENSGLIS